VGADKPPPLLARLLLAVKPELEDVAQATLGEIHDAVGPERIQRIRTAGSAAGKLLDLIAACGDQPNASKSGRREG